MRKKLASAPVQSNRNDSDVEFLNEIHGLKRICHYSNFPELF